ncbi:arrestin domain-containing protein 17-like [Homarus americanus]|uniref:arrestin domain-containing protein 17-like n=1 Tax=Homarus americanus TaxID=6706 RepID=UPI001C44F8E0|nr:arrestin domain-containing protein 17-like [Homarus americanus]
MGIKKFDIVLDPHQQSYCSGEDVVGRVLVHSDCITSCRAILVKARGFAKVEWENEAYGEEEVYFENIVTVWSGTSHGDNLPAGEYGFPFLFKLPLNIPRSFEGTYGHVRYQIEAKAEIPWGADQFSSFFFKVDCKYDLREDDKASEALMFHKESTACLCCREEGPIIISLCADKTGYIPGEHVLLTGEVTNRADSPVVSSNITLVETIRYNIRTMHKKKKTTLKTIERSGIPAGETAVWLSIPIYIPEGATCLQYCGIMEAIYDVTITFTIGFCSEISVTQSITIGTIPVGKVTLTVEGPPASPGVPIPSAPPMCNTSDTPSHEMQPILHQPKSLSDLSKLDDVEVVLTK